MKNILFAALICGFLAACNSQTTETETTAPATEQTTVTETPVVPETPVPVDSIAVTDTTVKPY